MRGLLFATLSLSCLAAQPDPREIMRHSLSADDRNWKITRNYTYLERNELHQLDSNGKVKSKEISTRETIYIGGTPYRRIVAKDDHPLSAAEEAKEQEKINRRLAEVKKETPADAARRVAEWERKIVRRRESFREIVDAFDFKLLGEEKIAGRDTYVLQLTPHPGYHAKNSFLSRLQGKLWIDKLDYVWTRAEAETLDTISFGLFLARLSKGSKLMFEQTRVNDEVWLPKRYSVVASARVALLKKFNIDQHSTFSGYRKFQAESRITSTSDIH